VLICSIDSFHGVAYQEYTATTKGAFVLCLAMAAWSHRLVERKQWCEILKGILQLCVTDYPAFRRKFVEVSALSAQACVQKSAGGRSCFHLDTIKSISPGANDIPIRWNDVVRGDVRGIAFMEGGCMATRTAYCHLLSWLQLHIEHNFSSRHTRLNLRTDMRLAERPVQNGQNKPKQNLSNLNLLFVVLYFHVASLIVHGHTIFRISFFIWP